MAPQSTMSVRPCRGSSRLLDLPFTSLKLDKDLVQQVGTSQEARSFLASTIDAAKARGLVVTAEGVETNSIWHDMAALGVDEMQGFLVARPLPVAAVPVWWDAWIESGSRPRETA